MKGLTGISRRSILLAISVLLLIATSAPSALLQSASLKQAVVAGGGGTSTGGAARMEASIGQPFADLSLSPSATLASGFWHGAIPCPFSASPVEQFFTRAGGAGHVILTATNNCNWSPIAANDWILITSGGGGASGAVYFEVRENFTGSARRGSFAIGDFTCAIVEDGGLGDACGYSISPTLASYPASGGAGSIQMSASDRCAWQAVSAANWVTINSGSVGIGNGTVTYLLAANPNSAGRNATITVAGKAFAVKQKGNLVGGN